MKKRQQNWQLSKPHFYLPTFSDKAFHLAKVNVEGSNPFARSI